MLKLVWSREKAAAIKRNKAENKIEVGTLEKTIGLYMLLVSEVY